jgi:nitroimidazol reductase NimA-like FMN-containing flavoprotein (pyridoxamine 5'-phosphate oxidase superfamily)
VSELKKEVENYINSTKYIVLGTVKDGIPFLRTIGAFANDGLTVYFSTNKNTEKVKHIGKNPHVSLFFQHEGQDITSFKNVSVIGRATQVAEKKEQDKAIGLIGGRNPRFKERVTKGEAKDAAFFKVEPIEVKFLDFSRGIGADSVKVVPI